MFCVSNKGANFDVAFVAISFHNVVWCKVCKCVLLILVLS